MRATKTKNRRRATVLLLVVSLLALLFVIVTGFLNLARTNRGMVADIQRSNLAEAISEDMADWGTSLIKEQVVNASGKVLAGGSGQNCSLEDIPGYRHSNYLAALEPVWDPAPFVPSALNNGSWAVLGQLRWPAVTSLDDGVTTPQPFPLFQLMRDYDFSNTGFRKTDAQWNARNPFMDADGDGVPDSHFLLCASATEAANTMAGASVQLPRYNPAGYGEGAFVPYRIPRPGFDPGGLFRGEKWQRYDEQARYEVAMRVISHGGMVTLDSPTLYSPNGSMAYTPFNRDFTINMFDAVRRGGLSMSRQYQVLNEQHRLFDDLSASVGAVESSLRRRFILPAPAEMDRHQQIRRIPPILAELQGERQGFNGFPGTLVPSFRFPAALSNPTNWQRINIGVDSRSGDERQGWALATAWNPTEYNTTGTGQSLMKTPYDRRHFITAINNSDELARKQTANDPTPTATNPLDLDSTGNRGATFEGELKYYLGEVSKAFLEVDVNGSVTPGSGRFVFDRDNRGKVIVEELARIYFEMLGGHSSAGGTDDWASLFPIGTGSNVQAVSRREQAFMLAVNTVAFAAPRDTNNVVGSSTRGFIDVVRYVDNVGTGATNLKYVGYAPQPFISEVIAFTDKETGEEDDEALIVNASLAVELYNPNDPYYDFNAPPPYPDVYALRLDQYALAVDNTVPGDLLATDKWELLPTFPLNGRSFATVEVDSLVESNDHFNSVATVGTVSLDFVADRLPSGGGGVPPPSLVPTVTINLWRKSALGPGWIEAWHHVDKIKIRIPTHTKKRWKAVHRDTTPTRYFGMVDLNNDGNIDVAGEDVSGDGVAPDTFARWNVVYGPGKTQGAGGVQCIGAPITTSLNNHTWLERLAGTNQGNRRDPDNFLGDTLGPISSFAPTVPLITMNAGPVDGGESFLYQQFNNMPMFGNVRDLRPRSFPTVGFMLFIPRFSHVQHLTPPSADERFVPIAYVLEEQWRRQPYVGVLPGSYPADFGHMPVFDNTQLVPPGSYFNNGTGVEEVPWGQLVFDYFTTLDPTQDVNGDGQPDVDPLRVPGRININTAPWYVLANLPMLGPTDGNQPPASGMAPFNAELPIRAIPGYVSVIPAPSLLNIGTGPWAPSPSFWDPYVSVLVGQAEDVVNSAGTFTPRLLDSDATYSGGLYCLSVPWYADRNGRYRLGPWLAQSAAAYRDGVQYVANNAANLFSVYYDSHLRDQSSAPYRLTPYGRVRGQTTSGTAPTQFGFVTLGELLNVKGFDSSGHTQLPPVGTAGTTTLGANPALLSTLSYVGDYVKAVSLVALLDSQYLTTRSNTFTVYTTVMDREDPQASVRSQVTVDRSNLLPRMTYAAYDNSGVLDPTWPLRPVLLDLEPATPDSVPETPVRTTNGGALPRVIAKERVGYYNARYDD